MAGSGAVVRAQRPVARTPSRNTHARREARAGWLFASPWLFGLLALTVGPMLGSLLLSMMHWTFLQPPVFVGFSHYRQLIRDPLIWHALLVTSVYAGLSVPLQLVIGLGLATLLNQKLVARGFFRTLFYVPVVISGVAVALLWKWIFSPQIGLLNTVLRWFGLRGPDWLGNPHTAIVALVIMSLWGSGGAMVIFLAGLQGVPRSLYDAARVDGGTAWTVFRRITIPILSPIILFVLVMHLIAALQIFTQPFIMTQGGPNNATMFYMLYLYQNAFQMFHLGYASAMAWLLFVYIIALTLVVFRSSSLWVYYEGTFGTRP